MKSILNNILLILSTFSLMLLNSCADDNIVLNYEGKKVFDFTRARVSLNMSNGIISMTDYGFFSCDSITVTFGGFSKTYKFMGYTRADTSFSVNITPKDSVAGSLLKLEGSQNGIFLTGKLYFCADANDCKFLEIGHIIGQRMDEFRNHYEGYYYSPLFYGEFDFASF